MIIEMGGFHAIAGFPVQVLRRIIEGFDDLYFELFSLNVLLL